MHKVNVIRLVSSYKKANTFIIEINEDDVLIIDLGNYPTDELANWLTSKRKKVLGLFLTHEHADHCYGIDGLQSLIKFPLFCSEKCEVNMRNPKQNFSRYIEEFETFSVQSKAIVIKDGQTINFKGFEITVMETPGHSPGGICLFAKGIVFTGDTLLNNVESPLTFPHSNRVAYQKSKNKILKKLHPLVTIYPGHDEPFLVNKNYGIEGFKKQI